MRVCLLCREYPPADGGGIGAYMHRYAHALAEAGCTVTVVTAAAGREPATRTDTQGQSAVTVIEIPVSVDDRWIGPSRDASDAEASAFHALGPASLFGMAAATHLPDLHAAHRFDVVESPETGASLWFILNSRRTGTGWCEPPSPVFVTHVFSPSEWIEDENRCPATSRGELALRWMEGDAARWSDAVVCSSHDLAAWVERQWNLDPNSVAIFPPPMGSVRAAAVNANASTERRLVYIGRLEPRKGIDIMLAAFTKACEHVEGLCLDLVGRDMIDARTGEFFGRRSLELCVPDELRSRVRLRGQLSGDELDHARGGAFAATLPGGWDNYPYTCVEAMAAGLPIIGARSGGVEQLVRDDVEGILFEPGDINGCADAIVRLAMMDADARHAMGEQAVARVRAICDNQAVVSERLAHYKSLLDERGDPQRTEADRASVVLINANDADQSDPLVCAVRRGLDFAIGWARTDAPPGVIASPTPTLESLAVFSGPIGPIAVARRALVELGEDQLIESGCCADARLLLRRLLSSGFEGAVVPEVNAQTSAITLSDEAFAFDPLAPVMAAWATDVEPALDRRGMTWRQRAEASEGELAQLRASRAMKLATGISRLSRTIRGIGNEA